jgi:hypothetical protein
LPSSRPLPDARRQMFLKLSGQIEGQLRDAYDKKFRAGLLNQSSLASKLDVNRSAIHHRLSGRNNMTVETIADMIWGLGNDFELKIFDPSETMKNHSIVVNVPSQPQLPAVPKAVQNTLAIGPNPNTSSSIIQKFLAPAGS